MFKQLHINVKVRLFEGVASRFTGSMILPFMTLYFAQHFGVQTAALLLMVNIFLNISTTLISGYLTDHLGRKKLIVIAETTRTIAFFIMLLASLPILNFPFLILVMMTVNGICSAISEPASQSMLIDVSGKHERKYIYSMLYWGKNVSMAVGGIIGAFLYEDYLTYLFSLLFTISVVVLIVISVFIKESHQIQYIKEQNQFKLIAKAYRKVFLNKLFLTFMLGCILLLSLELQLTNFIVLKLESEMQQQRFFEWNIDGVKMMGILRSENTMIAACLAVMIIKLVKNITERRLLLFGIILYLVGFSLLVLSHNVWILIIGMFIHTIGEIIYAPVQDSYMAELPPQEQRGVYMAFYHLQTNLAMLVVSLTLLLSAYFANGVIAIGLCLLGIIGFLIINIIIKNIEVTDK